MIILPGSQITQLRDALEDAFTLDDIERWLRERLDIRLESIAQRSTLSQTVFALIQAAERADWLQELLEAAYRERPRHPGLASLYKNIGLAPTVDVQHGGHSGGLESVERPMPFDPSTAGGFEAVVGRQDPTLDLDTWTAAAARVADQVCRIEKDGVPVGTGFLVGPDAVLTCDFVFGADFLEGSGDSDRYTFRFEYKVLADGSRSDGTVVGLHSTDWLIDYSPHAPTADRTDPTLDELGFALVRLARPVGAEPPAGTVGGRPRGWVWVPDSPHPLLPGTPVVIASYPRGEPLKISFDSNGMIGQNLEGTQVRYLANTYAGSAGAPCFDTTWNLFALHQGTTNANLAGPPFERQGFGVPTTAIRRRLTEVGKASALCGKEAQ